MLCLSVRFLLACGVHAVSICKVSVGLWGACCVYLLGFCWPVGCMLCLPVRFLLACGVHAVSTCKVSVGLWGACCVYL